MSSQRPGVSNIGCTLSLKFISRVVFWPMALRNVSLVDANVYWWQMSHVIFYGMSHPPPSTEEKNDGQPTWPLPMSLPVERSGVGRRIRRRLVWRSPWLPRPRLTRSYESSSLGDVVLSSNPATAWPLLDEGPRGPFRYPRARKLYLTSKPLIRWLGYITCSQHA